MQDRKNAGNFGLLSKDLIQYTTDSFLNTKEAIALRSTCRLFANHPDLLKLKKSKHKKVFSDKICSFILNGHGHLYGIGNLPPYLRNNTEAVFTPIILPNQLPIAQIEQHSVFHSDKSDTVILATDGTVYKGSNFDVSRYQDCDYQKNPMLSLIRTPKPIKQIQLGAGYMILLAEDGTVYGQGCNEYGNLGLNDRVNRCELHLIPGIENDCIKEVTTGHCHTLLLTNNGKVYGCGRNDCGQLGLGHQQDQATLTMLPLSADNSFEHVIVAGESTILIAADGTVYTCGSYEHYKNYSTCILNPKPILVPGNKPIKNATTHNGSVVLLAKDGSIYGGGFNSTNCLGLGDLHQPLQMIPVPGNKPIKQVSLGPHHLLVVTEDDEILGCGSIFSQLRRQKTKESLAPIDFDLLLQEHTEHEETLRSSKKLRC